MSAGRTHLRLPSSNLGPVNGRPEEAPTTGPKRDKFTQIPLLRTKVQLIIFLVCAMQARVCSAARPCSGASIIDVLSMNMTICNGEG